VSPVFNGHGVEVDIISDNNFLKIKETLERIGISSNNTLYQSCHILHKTYNNTSVYAIVHFKEMFLFDGKESTLTQEDITRRNSIAALLQKWGLLKLKEDYDANIVFNFEVIPYKDKHKWNLVSKYQIGKKQY